MQGALIHKETLRYTPAGIPLLSLTLQHASEQLEAGLMRKVECEVNAVAMGELALKTQNIEPGTPVDVSGFLARRSLRSTQLVLHINTIERIT
ncbi:MAG TPA: primosomal replication protein N [Methylophilaceae bacterium]|nr:primosomal replication protein N [Methylophilaceae bacterium]